VQVFLGLNEETGELLAVKEVDCSRAGPAGEGAIASLEGEIAMLQQLRHPNIVAYYGVHREPGRAVSVLVEYCAGGSIASVISKFGALAEPGTSHARTRTRTRTRTRARTHT
jgi:serine/threonine protein kinase